MRVLRLYVVRFNKEALLIYEANDKVFATVFCCGLYLGEFLFFVLKNDLKTIMGKLFRAMKYMNAEDSMIAQEENE